MLPVVFIMGSTCSGKGTFCDFAKMILQEHLHVIQIGKILRDRHPPEYFNGLAAQEKTEPEVWEIFEEEYYKGIGRKGVDVIFVDGQPRLPAQVRKCLSYANAFTDFRFVMLHASADARRSRIERRFPFPPVPENLSDEYAIASERVEANRKLAHSRIANDQVQLLDVWAELQLQGQYVTVCRTEQPAVTYQAHLLSLICGSLKDVR